MFCTSKLLASKFAHEHAREQVIHKQRENCSGLLVNKLRTSSKLARQLLASNREQVGSFFATVTQSNEEKIDFQNIFHLLAVAREQVASMFVSCSPLAGEQRRATFPLLLLISCSRACSGANLLTSRFRSRAAGEQYERATCSRTSRAKH